MHGVTIALLGVVCGRFGYLAAEFQTVKIFSDLFGQLKAVTCHSPQTPETSNYFFSPIDTNLIPYWTVI